MTTDTREMQRMELARRHFNYNPEGQIEENKQIIKYCNHLLRCIRQKVKVLQNDEVYEIDDDYDSITQLDTIIKTSDYIKVSANLENDNIITLNRRLLIKGESITKDLKNYALGSTVKIELNNLASDIISDIEDIKYENRSLEYDIQEGIIDLPDEQLDLIDSMLPNQEKVNWRKEGF